MKNRGKSFWTRIILFSTVTLLLIGFLIINSSLAKSNDKIFELEVDLDDKSEKIKGLEVDLKEKSQSIIDLEAKLDEAKPWFEMSEKEQERQMAEEEEKQEKEKVAAKKKEKEEKAEAKKKAEEEEKARIAAEKEEKKKREEEEKKGYETGITYEQLARTPDDFLGEKVKFSGRVVQVIEDDYDYVQLRIAVNDNYDNVIYVEYDVSIVDSRVLEDDQITVMGISLGLLTYDSTMGGKITIPFIDVEKIE